MAVTVLQAGRQICEVGDWGLSNLAIQKLLYIAHMWRLGERDEPLIYENFEAWDYGPVVPRLYHKAKAFGSGPVQNVFWSEEDISDSDEGKLLADVVVGLGKERTGKLVAITHWEEGAWARHYVPELRGKIISNESIKAEYERRKSAKKSA